jgi:hypothetical protein
MKVTRRGRGMRARDVPVAQTREEMLAALDALDAQLPVCQPGEAGGDALRRANAERMMAILRAAELPDDPVELARELAARGFAEDTAQHLAAAWLQAWRWWRHARERLLSGDVTPSTVAAITDAAQEVGEIGERMFWRAGIDPATGKRREALAVGKAKQELARPKATEARRASAADNEPGWWDDARQRAAEMRTRFPSYSRSRVAEKLAGELGRSRKQVAHVIKCLWR